MANGNGCKSAVPALRVHFAECEEDIRAAQKLRWQVFYEEMGAQPDVMAEQGLDCDGYDHFCDHLLVIDDNREQGEHVVGTYRLLRESVAMRHRGFYTAGEYDLTALMDSKRGIGGELLELGRSCVLPAYRNSGTIALLWRGIADYLLQHDIGLMIGCASFPGIDPEAHTAALSYLHHHHLAPRELRPAAHAEHCAPVELLPIGSYDRRLVMHSLPPLIKAYLRVGAMIGEGAFVDRRFNTVDVCIVMPVEMISQRYAMRFSIAA